MDNLISMRLGLWPDDAEKKCLNSTYQGVTA